jgi:DNA modification methylase
MEATLHTKRVPVDSLHLDPANARLHPDENLDAIAGSLRRFGQAEPLIVQAGTGRVVGGNGRLVVMKKLGWVECDVVELDIDDLTATALGIALNRTAETAAWDETNLVKLLEELKAEDALEGVGFDNEDIDALLAELDEDRDPAEIDDPGPGEPPEEPVSRAGDLWVLGDHRLHCGDSTSSEDVAKLMAGETAVLLSTDPPYCVNYTGMDRPIHDGKPSGKDWSHVYREVDIADLGQFLDATFAACLPHVAPNAGIYVWHAHVQQPVIAATFEHHGLLLHQVIVWVKPTATFGHCYYRWRHEPCAFGWKRGHKPAHGVGKLETVWEVDWEGKSRVVGNEHPTQKPLRLFETPMIQHTRPGAVLLEPFSGSGSQILAAERLGRRCRAMEIQPAFVDVAIKRWQQATGKTATLEVTGESFEAVGASRVGPEGGDDGEAKTAE